MNPADDSPKFIGKPGSLFYCHMTGNKKGYAQADEAIQIAWRTVNGLCYNNNHQFGVETKLVAGQKPKTS